MPWRDGSSTARTAAALEALLAPVTHATTHEPGGTDAMAVNAAAGTGSLRTLGTTATSAAAGNDSRLSDSRTPTAHATSHQPGGGDAMAVDAAAGTGSLRTLGTTATSAAPGTVDAAAGVGSVRTLGTGATQAAAGNHTHGASGQFVQEPYATEQTVIISGVSVTLNHIRGVRYVCPKAGTLVGMAAFLTATSGNFIFCVYDTSVTNLGLLASSGSHASGTINTWDNADFTSGLVVTAGQVVYLCVHPDNSTVAFGRTGIPANNGVSGPMPAGYLSGADAANLRCWDFSRGSYSAPAPATIAVASISASAPFVAAVKFA